jgi:hypothetical protein
VAKFSAILYPTATKALSNKLRSLSERSQQMHFQYLVQAKGTKDGIVSALLTISGASNCSLLADDSLSSALRS